MKYIESIEVVDQSDSFESNKFLGDLTEKQYIALGECARLSPGYVFQVWRYSGGPSSAATHVAVFKQDRDRDEVALVGKSCAQYYDRDKTTEAVVKRVAQRVYRRSGLFFN